jgi:predicted dehydrogenase
MPLERIPNMIRLAIVGTGGMAQGHTRRFQELAGCRLMACCDIQPGRAAEFARAHNIPAAYTDFNEMLATEALDAVSIVASDRAHAPIALAAIRRGLHVMCEKPLADSLVNARRMAQAARKKGVLTAVNFSYRNPAATQKAAQMVRSGRLGRILHVEGSYLQCWLATPIWGDWHTTPAFLWRMSGRHGSLGTLGDIGVHLYDLAHFVVGPFAALSCELQQFDKGVKRIGDYVFDVNDSLVTTVRVRVYGDRGAIDLNLDRPPESQLRICQGAQAVARTLWKDVVCPPVPDMYARFIQSIRRKQQGQTSFDEGAMIQSYLQGSLDSAQRGGWVKIKAN